MALLHRPLQAGMMLLMAVLLERAMASNAAFAHHRAADVSHTDRLYAQKSRSPYVVYDIPKDEQLEESREVRSPIVILEDSPRPVYREHVVGPNSENEPGTRTTFKFPPPRSEIPSSPWSQPSSVQYGFQGLHSAIKQRPITGILVNETKVPNSPPLDEATEELLTTKPPVITSTVTALTNSSIILHEKNKQSTVFEELENKEETQTREVYSNENPKQKQNDGEILQENYHQSQILSSLPSIDNTGKTKTKTVILDLRANGGKQVYYNPKKSTTYVLTRTYPGSTKRPTYLYKTAFDGRRAPTQSFTFFPSDVTPKANAQYQTYQQPADDSVEQQKDFSTGYEFTIRNNDQDSPTSDSSVNYNEYTLNSDDLPKRNEDSSTSDRSYIYTQHAHGDLSRTQSYTQSPYDQSSRLAYTASTDDSPRYKGSTSTAEVPQRYFTSHSTIQAYKTTRKPQSAFSTVRDYYGGIQAQETTSSQRELHSDIQQDITQTNPSLAPVPQTIRRDRIPNEQSISRNFGSLPSRHPFGPQSVPGQPGTDYPTYNEIPTTNFNCLQRKMPGFYADMEAGCQVFHTCDMDMRRHSFMCPNGTIFNQELFTCDWWYNVKCDNSPNFYELNSRLFKDPPKIEEDEKQR